MDASILRKGAAELVGTALLLGAALGGGKAAAAVGAPPYGGLLIGTLAAAAALFTILHAIGPVSGGHVNPAVTISMLAARAMPVAEAVVYISAQLVGGLIGAVAANALWDAALVAGPGSRALSTASYVAEVVATAGLVGAIHAAVRGGHADRLPMIVPSAVVAGSFAAPFSMANPAVALAAGIVGGGLSLPAIGGLVVVESIGGALVALAVAVLYGHSIASSSPVTSTEAASQQAFEVRFSTMPTVDQAVITEAIRAAIRGGDRVVPTSDGGWLVVLDDASDDIVESIRQRVATFVDLAVDVTNLEKGLHGPQMIPVAPATVAS